MVAVSNSGRVTVMVPSYNYARYLAEAVESAAAQPEADVVVVDNGSTDGSPDLGAELAGRHDNVRFVRYDTNDGIIASFNRCRAEIRGDYAMLLCADDMLTPGSLARSIDVLDARPDVGLAYGSALDFADSRDVDLSGLPSTTTDVVVHSGTAWIDRMCRFGRNPIRNPEAVMRSSVAADAGLYEVACPYTSDLNMWLRVAARSDVAYLRGPVQALFRQHDSNAGSAFPHNSLAELEQRWTAFERFLAAEAPARAVAWEAAARRRIAAEARYSASRMFGWQLEGDATELLDFAERLDPDGAHVAERTAWKVRHRLGPRASHRFPGFQVRPLVHRARRIVADRRRERVGIG